MHKTVSIVVAMYNEYAMVDVFFETLLPILDNVTKSQEVFFEIVVVDDGSHDNTLEKLEAWTIQDSRVSVLVLSRNFGKEAALTAGIEYAAGDAVIPIDADLQDPPELIEKMVALWKNGTQVVVPVRANRDSDSFIKRTTSNAFYKVFNLLCYQNIHYNAGDFRLLDRIAINALLQLKERNRFMKGLFSYVGFKTEYITFTRESRQYGDSKWNYSKLFNFAVDGITSFSIIPLRLLSIIGFIATISLFIYCIFFLIKSLLFVDAVKGFPTLIVVVLFIGSLQMLGLGIIGEYIGKIYQEVKQRPIYIVKKILRSSHG